MNKQTPISDELLARFLEGNVSEEERNLVSAAISVDESLQQTNAMASEILEEEQSDNQKYTIPEIDSSLQQTDRNSSQLPDDIRYQLADHGKIRFAAQNSDKTCAIQAQQIILRDYGIFTSEEDLLEISRQNGWYVEQSGCPIDYVGKLLNYYEIDAVQMRNATIYHIINELSQGHRVIVGINENNLSQNEQWRNFDKKLFGNEANHVLLVAGIDTQNTGNLEVIIKDPSNENNNKSLSAKEFTQLWNDAGSYMVSTTTPVPLRLNREMEHFDYHQGYIQQFADFTYQEIIKRLAEDGYISGKNHRNRLLNFFIFLIIFLLVILGAFGTWRFFSPINMKIELVEDSAYKIPNLPFEKGKLTVTYSSMTPQIFTISPDNLTIVIDEIHYKNKGKEANLLFEATGYQTVDTIVKIDKMVKIPLRRDNSLSIIFGTIIDSGSGQSIDNVTIKVQDIETHTDKNGNFRIEIPLNKQAPEQNLKAFKEGYQIWDGTYSPSPTNGWNIVMNKTE